MVGTASKANSLLTSCVVVSWFLCNISVIFLNKVLLSNDLKAPVFLTLCHMSACVLVGGAMSSSGLLPLQRLKSVSQACKIFILACIFSITIVAANASLRYISVSFNQAIGAITPFFTAIFAICLQGIHETPSTYASLIPIVGGVMFASGGEPSFHALGVALCLAGTAGRALKSVVQAMLLSNPAERLDPMSLLLYMSGISVALLFPATFFLEPEAFQHASELVQSNRTFLLSLMINSLLAYFLNLTNFLVTKFTSALTLQVLGNAKVVIAAALSILVFKNAVTPLGAIGFAITVMGTSLYSSSKRTVGLEKKTQ